MAGAIERDELGLIALEDSGKGLAADTFDLQLTGGDRVYNNERNNLARKEWLVRTLVDEGNVLRGGRGSRASTPHGKHCETHLSTSSPLTWKADGTTLVARRDDAKHSQVSQNRRGINTPETCDGEAKRTKKREGRNG